MEKEIIYNENLHFEHKQWQSELAFWEDELKSFTNRLEELVNKWTKKEVLTQLEHFQNEFILQDGIIDRLKEEIEKHESRMAGQSLKGENAMDTVLTMEHLGFRKKMETQRHIYAELKKEFFSFLSKYL
jgi:hypothetical protein